MRGPVCRSRTGAASLCRREVPSCTQRSPGTRGRSPGVQEGVEARSGPSVSISTDEMGFPHITERREEGGGRMEEEGREEGEE